MIKRNFMTYMPVAQYSEIYGKSLSWDEIKIRLSKLDCQEVISIAYKLFALQDNDKKSLLSSLRILHGGHIFKKSGNLMYYNRSALCGPQTLFQLEKAALMYCSNEDESKGDPINNLLEVLDILTAINDYLPKDISNNKIEYLYLTLYHNTPKLLKAQIGRGYYIFVELMKECPSTRDFENDFTKKMGYTLEEYFAVMFGTLSVVPTFIQNFDDVLRSCAIPNNFDAKGLSDVYAKIIESSSLSYEALKNEIENKNLIEQSWNFEPFYRVPFISFNNYIIPNSLTTLKYSLWEGLYWKIRFIYGKGEKKFLNEFGRPFELYIQDITQSACQKSNGVANFLNEFKYNYKREQRLSSDSYIKIGEFLIVIEAKAKSPRAETFMDYNRDICNQEISDLLIDPTYQISNRIDEILSCDIKCEEFILDYFADIKKVIALTVSMEKVMPVGELLLFADNIIKNKERSLNSKIYCYHNINIDDYEALCNLVEKQPEEIPQILFDWFKSQRTHSYNIIPLANYLLENGYECNCPSGVTGNFNNAMKSLYKKVFNK